MTTRWDITFKRDAHDLAAVVEDLLGESDLMWNAEDSMDFTVSVWVETREAAEAIAEKLSANLSGFYDYDLDYVESPFTGVVKLQD